MAETALALDPALIAELHRQWIKPLPDETKAVAVDTGAIVHIARFLHSEHTPLDWRREATRLIPRIRAVLQHAGASELEAHGRARLIAAEAVLCAQDEADAAKANTEHGDYLRSQGRQNTLAPRTQTGKAPLVEHISAVSARVIDAGNTPPGVMRTPFSDLNFLLNGGFWPGEFTILGARPSVGKSALASQFTRALAWDAQGVLFVSREMPNLAIVRRMIAQEGKLDAGALRSGIGADWVGTSRSAASLHGLPIWLTDKVVSVEQIDQAIDAVGEQIRFVVVDYLQLMEAPRHIRDLRQQVEFVSKALKALALKRQIPVLALSSLSRPAAGTEKRPTLASLRESGALEHDADAVLLLHRERDGADTECIVAKNRDGRVGIVHLQFRPDWVGFDAAAPDVAWGEKA